MKKSTVLTLVALAFGLTIALYSAPRRSQASPLAHAAHFAALPSNGEICPLTKTQQEESAKAFAELMPTFQHPRCANCHGGVLPFAANGNHAGGKFDVVFSDEGDVLLEETFGECQVCHGGLPGWEVPTIDLAFVGKDALELCKQMKATMNNEENFLDHLTRDRGRTPFIATAFAGRRGLNEEGAEFYEALNDRTLVPEPPPLSQAALIAQGQAWVEAMGGKFQGDTGCGCEPQYFALQIDESLLAAFVSGQSRIDWDGSTRVQVPLIFREDLSFTGTATSSRTVNARLTSEVNCEGRSTSSVQWAVDGRFDDIQQTISFSVRFTPAPGTVNCNLALPVPLLLPIPIADTESGDNPLRQVELDAYVGQSKTVQVNTNVPGNEVKETFVIEIIRLD